MKIAVLSDIHGNYQALEAVVKDIKAQNCEKVLCLGDIAMAGPEPSLVIDFVQKQTNWTVIQGNTDKMITEYSDSLYETLKSVFPVMAEALKDDVSIIEKDKIEYLRNLPIQKSLVIEGVKVLLVHGSPRRNNEDILPDMPLEKVEEMVQGVQADLIFCGHTHIPCGYQTNNKKTIVNTGSVGRPMSGDPRACYVIANFKDGGFTIEHRLVDYDKELAAKIIRARNFRLCEQLAEMVLNPKSRHA